MPASVAWNDRVVARFGTDDTTQLFWSQGIDGVREETWHDTIGGRPTRKTMCRAENSHR